MGIIIEEDKIYYKAQNTRAALEIKYSARQTQVPITRSFCLFLHLII